MFYRGKRDICVQERKRKTNAITTIHKVENIWKTNKSCYAVSYGLTYDLHMISTLEV